LTGISNGLIGIASNRLHKIFHLSLQRYSKFSIGIAQPDGWALTLSSVTSMGRAETSLLLYYVSWPFPLTIIRRADFFLAANSQFKFGSQLKTTHHLPPNCDGRVKLRALR